MDAAVKVLDLPDWDGEVSFSPSSDSARILARRKLEIRQILAELNPDRVLVDYLPLGLGGELMDALLDEQTTTRFVWGVPYPGREKKAPRNPRVRRALQRYSQALIYTSPNWLDPYDTYKDYVFPEKVEHVGVVVPEPCPWESGGEPPLVVGLAGAGIGAPGLFELISEAALGLVEQEKIRLRVVAGVFHQKGDAVERLRKHPLVELWEKGGAEEATRDADVVLSRCGYNTAFSLVRTPLPVAFVPWASPDPAYTEQFDRAKALATLPGVWWLDERDPQAVETLKEILTKALDRGPLERTLPFQVEGARRAAQVLCDD